MFSAIESELNRRTHPSEYILFTNLSACAYYLLRASGAVRFSAFQCVSVRIKYADALHAVFLNITSCNGGFAMAKSLKKSAKRAADDRQQDPSAANIDPRTEADIGRLVDKYKNRSESSLMDELLRVTEQQKRDGTLDSAGIQAAANSILPMLNAEQAKKLNAILSKIT